MIESRVVQGPYFNDLFDQPRAIRDTLRALSDSGPDGAVSQLFQENEPSLIVLTGMGSSLHALHPLCARLNRHGRTAMMLETSELLQYPASWFRGKTLVAVSQSGKSVEIVRLLKRRLELCSTIGVTNTPGSPLDRRADVCVHMKAGDEFSVSCKTYLATLPALTWLGDVLCGTSPKESLRLLESDCREVEAYLRAWKSHVACLEGILKGIEHLFLVGRGGSLAATGTGGLIIKEAAHFHAEGMSASAFRHGPLEMLSERVLVLVFSGERKTSHLNLRLAEDVRKAGGRAAIVGEESDTDVFRLPRISNQPARRFPPGWLSNPTPPGLHVDSATSHGVSSQPARRFPPGWLSNATPPGLHVDSATSRGVSSQPARRFPPGWPSNAPPPGPHVNSATSRGVSSQALPIFEILPAQMITLALSAMSGREAGRFERASKITNIE